MPYFRFKVLVEYDGWWHERDGRQRQRDRVRREALEAAGWRVIVITSEDLKDARLIPWRVFNALKDRGFAGPSPRMNAMWIQWFA
jgi:very-short-patch-repair endonuclease